MYNEQLEQLIEFALLDGELQEKEKDILLRKAESFGIDLDEFEMVLQARLFEKQQSNKKVETPITTQPKSEKFGDIKKCPACGAMIQSFQTKCPDCDYSFSNIAANSSIQRLFELLNDAEGVRQNTTANLFGKLQTVFGVNDTDKRKLEIISTFPIPNTKEDMLEFLSLALPKSKIKKFAFIEADSDKIPNMYAKAWREKCEQIIMKARFSMKDDKKTLEEINDYAKKLGIK